MNQNECDSLGPRLTIFQTQWWIAQKARRGAANFEVSIRIAKRIKEASKSCNRNISQHIATYRNAIYARLLPSHLQCRLDKQGKQKPGQFTSAGQRGDCMSRSVNRTPIYTVCSCMFDMYVWHVCSWRSCVKLFYEIVFQWAPFFVFHVFHVCPHFNSWGSPCFQLTWAVFAVLNSRNNKR